MSEALELSHVSCGFSSELFEPISFSLLPGTSISITGRSGVGKSTLLATILGIYRPLQGKIMVGGTDIHSLGKRQLARLRSQMIGTIFQGGALLAEYDALANVMLPRVSWDRHDSHAQEKARELLVHLDVDPMALANNLSGGEKSRVALARALINDPQIILADEPTAALDPQLSSEVTELIFSLTREHKCALVIVTHDPILAAKTDFTVNLIPRTQS
ncbi:ABC transporter ATP-binding protein [Arcanobacterium canis]